MKIQIKDEEGNIYKEKEVKNFDEANYYGKLWCDVMEEINDKEMMYYITEV